MWGKENNVPAVHSVYGHRSAETWGLREAERRRLNVFGIKCLRPMVRVTRCDRVRNDKFRMWAEIQEILAEKADWRVLRWVDHVELMGEGCRQATK